jgi:Glyoxalase-like domain
VTAWIDHVIYAAADLDAAAERIAGALGLQALGGGRHDGLGTHNRVIPLGGGGFVEILAVADRAEAQRSALGAALLAAVERGDGLIGWAVGVTDVDAVARHLGMPVSTVGRQGMTARLAAVDEALRELYLPFFIERTAGPQVRAPGSAGIEWLEVAGDAARLEHWLGGAKLPVRVVSGEPGLRRVRIGDGELRSA